MAVCHSVFWNDAVQEYRSSSPLIPAHKKPSLPQYQAILFQWRQGRWRATDVTKEYLENKFSSFLYATTQTVCPLRLRFWCYTRLKVSTSFVVTLCINIVNTHTTGCSLSKLKKLLFERNPPHPLPPTNKTKAYVISKAVCHSCSKPPKQINSLASHYASMSDAYIWYHFHNIASWVFSLRPYLQSAAPVTPVWEREC